MASSRQFPYELIIMILKHTPDSKFLLNRQLTEEYLIEHYRYIELPRQKDVCFRNSKIFDYPSFVEEIDLELSALDESSDASIDYGAFKNAIMLNIDDADGEEEQFHKVKSLMTNLKELVCHELPPITVLDQLDALQNLQSLEICHLCDAIRVINKMPNLKELRLISSLYGLNGFTSDYQNIEPLRHVKTLICEDQYQEDLSEFSRIFPNLYRLSLEGYDSVGHIKLDNINVVELSCYGSFDIPKTVKRLTCINQEHLITIPQSTNSYDSVCFLFETIYTEIGQNADLCLNFANKVNYPCCITFEEELTICNKKAPPFNRYTYKKVGDFHVYAKPIENCYNTTQILSIPFVRNFLASFPFEEAGWTKNSRWVYESDDLEELAYMFDNRIDLEDEEDMSESYNWDPDVVDQEYQFSDSFEYDDDDSFDEMQFEAFEF
eukprot:NODE_286_length_10728_cov_0.553298.p4 type:complete len:436 gc:universal NODE_286_length_10728_cov_0.553298:7331-6024(-)